MGELKFGPARVPSQESPEAAVELLVERGYTACEIDFEGRFWMDYDFATRLGELARLDRGGAAAGDGGIHEEDREDRRDRERDDEPHRAPFAAHAAILAA